MNIKSNQIKVILAFLFAMALTIQSCNKSDEIDPNAIDSELSASMRMDWNEFIGELPDPCVPICLVAGQHINVGSVDVAVDGENLLVTYNIIEEGIFLEEVHLEIFTSLDELKDLKKINGGGAVPGRFDYQKSFAVDDEVSLHTVEIPLEDIESEDGCFKIAAHAALTNGETAWGGICNDSENGVHLDDAEQFPGSNWSVYFDFCLDWCVSEIDFTYAWEDLTSGSNDMDYNDLVIQSEVIKLGNELNINFLASARGAAYDHEFKIKIPVTGVGSILDKNGIAVDPGDPIGGYYYITVFESTKDVLDETVGGFAANTFSSDKTCGPVGLASLSIGIDGTFPYVEDKPYEPLITVWPSGTVGDGDNSYDLYIYEVSGLSTFIKNDKEYPNGILIPEDWKWPVEKRIITDPYPDFSPVGPEWDDDWWNVPNLNPSWVWSCSQE